MSIEIEKRFRLSLLIVGVMFLIVTAFHGLWHWFFPLYGEMEGLTPLQWDIINLFNWAITFFLLFMSLLTLMIARTKSIPLNHLRVFSVLLFGFWICRLALEFLFPVRIPFIIIPNPSMFLKVIISIGLIILATPELLMRIQMIREGKRKKDDSV